MEEFRVEISKAKMVSGVTSYVRSEIIPNITDSNFKFIATAALAAMDVNPDLANLFFDNALVKSFENDNGTYNVDQLEKILTKTLTECGSYILTIPAIKFVMPHEQELTFTANDASALFKHIRSVN